MKKPFQHFGVIGAGAWGTALAAALTRANCDVTIWAHEAETVQAINHDHENKIFMPGVTLDHKIKATGALTDLAKCDTYILVTPAQHTREICKQLKKIISSGPIIIAAKGIELKSSALMSNVVATELPKNPIAILSGPSFAAEVAKGLPAALTLAVKDPPLGDKLLQSITSPPFRLYMSDDIVGAQIGGAVKNVLAIACGITVGKKMGDNARAAIITRGLTEIIRLGAAMGGRAETLMGLSGLGDLVLTCSSPQSRNMSLGIALGEGKLLADILGSRASVAEGVTTAAATVALAEKYRIEMPIVTAVDAVLNKNASIESMVAGLLARPLKVETA